MKSKTLNNLNTLRLAAAGLVLYGHSFVFLGLPEPVFLSWLPLGTLGVYIFFAISGYLVTQSWQQDPHLLRFFQRRALRIFPALIVCTLLSMLLLGPLLSTLPLDQYFSHAATWHYLKNIALYITYYLPGVFEHLRVPNAVNGSLWSLPVEFFMYIMVALLGMLSGRLWLSVLIFAASAAASFFWAQATTQMLVVYATDLRQVFICGTYFWAGALFYQLDIKRYFSLTTFAVAAVAMLCLETFPTSMHLASWVLLPFVVLAFGLSDNSWVGKLTASGDYSYGFYIYAFPVQQAIVFLYPGMALPSYLLLSTALTFTLAMLSWHGIEQPMLRLKPFNPRNPTYKGALT
ncbi:acyltransferase [Undibacterium sp. TS12]|uniref:acyltransferase family protein n=1 Tax=Undibacterium sp. TS12 TaxID=2908202 RepID=UPI001F4D22AB|nr:acyltransferase [Undibacterium sp. TS12]MCH8622381.1 acyltransferase [Undibacterium sp. TS12]